MFHIIVKGVNNSRRRCSTVKHVWNVCHKHNSLLLGPIQPSSASTRELHRLDNYPTQMVDCIRSWQYNPHFRLILHTWAPRGIKTLKPSWKILDALVLWLDVASHVTSFNQSVSFIAVKGNYRYLGAAPKFVNDIGYC